MNDAIPFRARAVLFVLAALILTFLAVPILIVVPMSFSDSRYLDFPPAAWSMRWYERLWESRLWSAALVRSLQIAIATVLVAGPVGVAAAYAIHNGRGRFLRAMNTLFLLPLVVPHMIVAIGIFFVYVRLGMLGSFVGLVLAHSMLAVPFVVVTTLSGLRAFDPAQERAALSLGCTRWQAFRMVTLPQIRGSVLSGLLFAFVTSMDEVVVSIFVAAGSNMTITKVMFTSLRDELDPTIAAVSTILISGSIILASAAALARRVAK